MISAAAPRDLTVLAPALAPAMRLEVSPFLEGQPGTKAQSMLGKPQKNTFFFFSGSSNKGGGG